MKKTVIYMLLTLTSCILRSQERLAVYENGSLVGEYYFDKAGELEKEVAFNISNKERDILYYRYRGPDLVSVQLKGSGNVIAFDEQRELMYYQDTKARIELLSKYQIIIPFARINGNIVSDISNIFSVSDTFKQERDGNKRIISFDSVYANIRFNTSTIEQFFPPNTILHNYELTLKSDTVQNEKYIFDGGTLYRRYFYQDGILIKIESECKYNDDKKIYKSKKEFR